MKSRNAILEAVRRQHREGPALPDFDNFGVTYDDPYSQFAETLEAVGGQAVRIANDAELRERLAEHEAVRSEKSVFSTRPDLVASSPEVEQADTPQSLDGLQLAIASGELAVAENGAIWVTDAGIPHRAALFIAEHLILAVRADALVHNMHQAYERIDVGRGSYGVFISGPSKTADIEQSLVIGAQGPRSLQVYLLDDSEVIPPSSP